MIEELQSEVWSWREAVPSGRATAESLNASRRALEMSAGVMTALDGVPTPVIMLNQQRQIAAANEAFRETVAAADLDAIIGDRFGEAMRCASAGTAPGGCGGASGCTACGAHHAALDALRGARSTHECSISRQLDGGAVSVDLRVTTTPMRIEGQAYVMFAMVNIDSEKRRQTLERIFFHDIRNTAAIFHGVADIIESSGGYMVSGLDAGELLRQASSRFLDEIDSQQQLLAAEQRALAVQIEPVLIGTLLREIAQGYTDQLESNGRRVQLSPDSQQFLMDTDRRLLIRVIGNMIKNAIEASSVDQPVTVGAELDGKKGRIWVHNQSVMPGSAKLQMFKRSFSTKGAGRGLGTYSMKLLTEGYLGGSISFRSEPEEGTTFAVTFPLDFDAGGGSRAAGGPPDPSRN